MNGSAQEGYAEAQRPQKEAQRFATPASPREASLTLRIARQRPWLALALLLVAVVPSVCAQDAATPRRVIAVNYAAVKGPRNLFAQQVVGAGRAAEGLRADWQRDLALVQRECGFKYIRFHGLLQDEMGVYREDKGRPVYNFQYVDALYDAILGLGMKPFVELSFMPQALASGSQTIFWWRGNVTPPKDYDKWAQLIQALVRHWTERYGREEVQQWYFEVWNEPNLSGFWAGTQADYFRLYAVTVQAIKSVAPEYRVGGPATAGNGWVPETINFVQQNNLPLDFIATHDYGVYGQGLDEQGVQQLFLDPKPEAIIGSVRNVRQQIEASAKKGLPLHYTEWSTSYSPRDPVHDSYLSAPYILSKLKGAEGYADSMSYWTFTDNFEEPGPVPTPFHGGFGLLNFQGLRKPAFYAYQFLNRLGPTELKNDDAASWACRSARGAQILFWNFTPPDTKVSNQVRYARDFPAQDFGSVRVAVAGMPPGTYRLNVYRVGYQVNDVFDSYLKMGAPAQLTREQVATLAAGNSGRPITTINITIDPRQTFTRDFAVRENEAFLVTLDTIITR